MLTQLILGIIFESIKVMDVVTTITRWHHNHWFLANKKGNRQTAKGLLQNLISCRAYQFFGIIINQPTKVMMETVSPITNQTMKKI